MMGPVEGALPSISSKGMGWGWGWGCRWCWIRILGSRKESEAPESTNAVMEMGGWPTTRR